MDWQAEPPFFSENRAPPTPQLQLRRFFSPRFWVRKDTNTAANHEAMITHWILTASSSCETFTGHFLGTKIGILAWARTLHLKVNDLLHRAIFQSEKMLWMGQRNPKIRITS